MPDECQGNMRTDRNGGEREPVNASPSPVEEHGLRKVMIIPVENGFIVEIGCKRFVFEDWELVAEGLGLYFKDPEAAAKKFCKK